MPYGSLWFMCMDANVDVMQSFCFLYGWMRCMMEVLYGMIDMPIEDIISHLICNTILSSWDMCECNGFKLSAKLFCTQEFSKEARIAHLVAVVELGDK